MRHFSLAALLALAVLAAGCGGSDIEVEQVPGPPPTVALPGGEVDISAASDSSADPDEEADADAADDAGGAADSGGAAAAPPADSGAAAPQTSEPAAPAPTAEPPSGTGGADADAGLDQFCADNPGAC